MGYIVVVDYGSQYSQLVARQIRKCQVYCEIFSPKDVSKHDDKVPQGLILSGNASVDSDMLELGVPILAIDYAPGGTGEIIAGNSQTDFHTVQLSPDAITTSTGLRVLEKFITDICKTSRDWTMEAFAKQAIAQIRAQVGTDKVICGLSGGIDSVVAAVLVHQAVGDQLTNIYVDHGFMRKGETEQIVQTFGEQFQLNLIHVDARTRFLAKITGVTDPEEKRKLIGNEFIRVFEEQAVNQGDAKYLVQGTIYPDVIESGTSQTAVIKSHHNVGGLPEDLQFSLVEPLRQLFKDEVRELALVLGLPEEVAWRHPFPGPGLAIRIIGEVTQERLDILREADDIMISEIKKAGLYRDIWQAFVVLTNTQTVGVSEEMRTYDSVAALRAVNSDGIAADWVRIPYDVLDKISTRIMREVKGINRVVYDISPKPPATIEWE